MVFPLGEGPTRMLGAPGPMLEPDQFGPTELIPRVTRTGGSPRGGGNASVGRASGLMAVANLASRVTGFIRQVALFSVLGATVLNDSYNVSNTLPNIVYELLVGGVLSSVLIPLLIRAQRDDADGGVLYTRRLLTLATVALCLATAASLAAAPLLTSIYIDDSTNSDPALATTFAYLLLPQILFYGIGALFGAMLNSRGAFGAFAWAPVLNNVVVIAVAGLYLIVPDPAKLLVLGVGTTLGIAAQALVLIPAVRRAGFSFRPAWGWDPRIGHAGRLAGWATLYTLIGLPGFAVTSRVATGAADGSLTIYNNAWLMLQVPYGILGVSLLTALMPRMSRAAAEGRVADVVDDLSLGARLSAALLLPITAVLTAFGGPIGTALFGLRASNLEGAALLGDTIAVSAFGLLPYAITMLQLRVFYAMTDSRTPVLIQLVTVGVKIPLLLLCPVLLPPGEVVLGLAITNSLSFVAGAVLGQYLLRRRLGALPVGAFWATSWRAFVAGVTAAAIAFGVTLVLTRLLLPPGGGGIGQVALSWVHLIAALVIVVPLTIVFMRLLGARELDPLAHRVERLVGRWRRGHRSAR